MTKTSKNQQQTTYPVHDILVAKLLVMTNELAKFKQNYIGHFAINFYFHMGNRSIR